MSPRNKGGGQTPDNVVKLLKDEVARTSQAATARATGLTLKGVQNYLKGIGEPTTATLQKLADYFGVSVAWLRGEDRKTPSLVIELLKADVERHGIDEVFTYSGLKPITVKLLLAGDAEPNEASLRELSDYYCVSITRLKGDEPDKYSNMIMQFKQNLDRLGAYLITRTDIPKDTVFDLCEAIGELESSLSNLSDKISEKMK